MQEVVFWKCKILKCYSALQESFVLKSVYIASPKMFKFTVCLSCYVPSNLLLNNYLLICFLFVVCYTVFSGSRIVTLSYSKVDMDQVKCKEKSHCRLQKITQLLIVTLEIVSWKDFQHCFFSSYFTANFAMIVRF